MKMHRLWVTFFAICVGLLMACSSANDPGSAVSRFYEAAASGNVDASIKLVSLSGIKADDIPQVIMVVRGMQLEFAEKGGLKSVKIVNVEAGDPDHATVHWEFHLGNGSSVRGERKVVRENGRWLVSFL